ncbi:stage II sporulation protein M [Paraflavitalea sp. CAU 1676]|uniref:stage II sporulation protein M n=1 Tax=Paraflavitalea sp. CAU 1676 TaxID=3032598 RepID=UPI0023D9D9A6|nr:stage II sporulation protein M [Paraflavitalea sp. CAU 1676]MDF2190168.1 stage II sporulation protein M [Paraflavitalea sp. CAU 1676]
MREGLFLKKNIEKWKQYQYESASNPDEMAQQFTELVNDLGYAKTFYPHSKVTTYLNGLASKIYLGIYRNKREESSRFARFWKTELPLTVRRHHRELLYAFLIFTSLAIMAAFSAAHDETFVRGVLGDGYVEMTEDNIAKGDPFGVYKDENRIAMFMRIALNNIQVSLLVFVAGIFLSLGTAWFLFQNGIMLGAFQYMFFAKGLGWSSVLVIWIHGTLEISAIIIAGGAGFILGNSILFPKTRKRIDSLKKGAKDGLKLMIGLVPIFIVAAFLEGYVTRYSSMPQWLSIAILALSFNFILWYFVLYPIRLEKKTLQTKPQ